MAPLNVIALISGGKDSIFSILHVLSLGHKIIALGNLHPPLSSTPSPHDGNDPESHMYQTAGHSLIPYIATCLSLPLIRREIRGTNVARGATYVRPGQEEGQDETEDLDLLLGKIVEMFPEANAVSSGAILSTYQRTRIEAVALRRGLVPLALLWQYTSITAAEGEDALLKHMQVMGMEARIVKVASGGLDEGNLWADVASYRGRESIKKRIMRFGEGEGAVIGEGGEFETLVLDGPGEVWRYRIVVEEEMRMVVKGEGGTASMAFQIPKDGKDVCRLEEKTVDEKAERPQLPKPKVLEDAFQKIFDALCADSSQLDALAFSPHDVEDIKCNSDALWPTISPQADACPHTMRFTISGTTMEEVTNTLRSTLLTHALSPKAVTSTTVIIKRMADFPILNHLYKGVFSYANPPSRACVAVGDLLPMDVVAVMHVVAYSPNDGREGITKALHVQSRSYWAPANIGPYSQAQSFPLSDTSSARGVSVAGQIPLIPATMAFTTNFDQDLDKKFAYEATLAAQHAWRIGKEMGVQLFTTGTLFLPRLLEADSRKKAIIAGKVWASLHARAAEPNSDDEDGSGSDVDLWELQNRRGEQQLGASSTTRQLPDWDVITVHPALKTWHHDPAVDVSPFFAAEVEELPMGAAVEWLPGLGVAGLSGEGKVVVLPRREMWLRDKEGRTESCQWAHWHYTLVDGKWLFSTYFVYLPEEWEDWKYMVERLRGELRAVSVEGAEFVFVDKELTSSPERSYVDVAAPVGDGFWEAVQPGVVPCRRLWTAGGQRLAAVVQFKDRVVRRDGIEGMREARRMSD